MAVTAGGTAVREDARHLIRTQHAHRDMAQEEMRETPDAKAGSRSTGPIGAEVHGGQPGEAREPLAAGYHPLVSRERGRPVVGQEPRDVFPDELLRLLRVVGPGEGILDRSVVDLAEAVPVW